MRVDASDVGARRAALSTLALCLDAWLRLSHPMTPFVTDELWHRLALARNGSLCARTRSIVSRDQIVSRSFVDTADVKQFDEESLMLQTYPTTTTFDAYIRRVTQSQSDADVRDRLAQWQRVGDAGASLRSSDATSIDFFV